MEPEVLDDKYIDFLDDLRETGKVNMMAAPGILVSNFSELNKEQATTVFWAWADQC